jgi:hypothetical protein
MADPFVPLIEQTPEKYPTLRASCLYAMARERGYTGGPDHFRQWVLYALETRSPMLRGPMDV